MAEVVESKGYAKYAETLRRISEGYINEAESNIREHKLEQEAQRREGFDGIDLIILISCTKR